MALIGINLYMLVFVYNCGFLMALLFFYWQLWVFDDNYGFLMTIMGFYWQLWVFIGNYGFLLRYYPLCFGNYGYLIDFLTSFLQVIELLRNHWKLFGKCLRVGHMS